MWTWRRYPPRLQKGGLLFSEIPGGAVAAPPDHPVPESPIDGAAADRFLFATPDTRFGDRTISSFFLDEHCRIAIAAPAIGDAELTELYRRHYSAPPTEPVPPPVGPSPFRGWFGGTRLEGLLLAAYPIIGRIVGKLAPVIVHSNRHFLGVLIRRLERLGLGASTEAGILDVGCFEGGLLDEIRAHTKWQTHGLEMNPVAAGVARRKGHRVWLASAEDALTTLPADARFRVIVASQLIEHLHDPVRALARLRLLLEPGGVIVLATPNLNSAQVRWFGPTWAHWHPPYHRHIFSPRGLRAVVEQAGLSVAAMSSHSYPYWSAMSLQLNAYGLAGSVSHAAQLPGDVLRRGRYIAGLSRALYDWRLQGDDLLVVCRN
ncbi:MAG TPA: class I SAM-dependent methyltransferase [Bauldia sp.]|nr:class I SAM-dependent methyltransferase [Bauldia sp.]